MNFTPDQIQKALDRPVTDEERAIKAKDLPVAQLAKRGKTFSEKLSELKMAKFLKKARKDIGHKAHRVIHAN